MNNEPRTTNSLIEFPPWYGELGWEIMSWAPLCRRAAQGREVIKVTSFEGMQPLYADFVTEFHAHDVKDRSLKYPKAYRPNGLYYQYGQRNVEEVKFDVLIHARGIARKRSINYRYWPELTEMLKSLPLSVAFIGGPDDQCVTGWPDCRGIPLTRLMNYIADARLTVGLSSGVMHLAAACGCDLVVWGHSKTYYYETLEQRYKMTWNPFEARVGWIYADDWQPEPKKIIEKIERML